MASRILNNNVLNQGLVIKYFCPLPFNSISINSSGAASVCCHSTAQPSDPNGIPYNFNKQENLSISEVLNSSLHKELRRDFIEGKKNKACGNCWAIENANGYSYRNAWNDSYKHRTEALVANTSAGGELKELIADYVELSLGNNCNLRCRSCNPTSSALWVSEALALGLQNEDDILAMRNFNWYKKSFFKEQLKPLLAHAGRINFLGGEPLIIDEHFEILSYLVQIGRAAEIELQYNSNVSVLSPKLSELWPKFKKVRICASIDGVGALNDYLRFPSKWSIINKNLSALSELKKIADIDVSIASTFQALNVMYISEVCKFVSELPYSFEKIPLMTWVSTPEYLDPRVLPMDYRKKAFQKNMEMLTELESQFASPWIATAKGYNEKMLTELPEDRRLSLWNEFVRITLKVDQLRKQKLTSVSPELGSLVYHQSGGV